jgi:hypothetical protein
MECSLFSIPRNERNVFNEIDVLLHNLSTLYSEFYPETDQHEFRNIYFKELSECVHTCGDTLANQQKINMDSQRGASIYGAGSGNKLAALVISCAYCCQAQRAFDNNDINIAWSFVVDAYKWCDKVMPQAKRARDIGQLDHKKRISIKRSAIVKVDRNAKYRDRQIYFINNMYASKAWGSKTQAIKEITESLQDYIIKNNLPVENVRNEYGVSEKKEDWTSFVKNALPSAKQIKIDAKEFDSKN